MQFTLNSWICLNRFVGFYFGRRLFYEILPRTGGGCISSFCNSLNVIDVKLDVLSLKRRSDFPNLGGMTGYHYCVVA